MSSADTLPCDQCRRRQDVQPVALSTADGDPDSPRKGSLRLYLCGPCRKARARRIAAWDRVRYGKKGRAA